MRGRNKENGSHGRGREAARVSGSVSSNASTPIAGFESDYPLDGKVWDVVNKL